MCVYVLYFYLAACGPKSYGSGLLAALANSGSSSIPSLYDRFLSPTTMSYTGATLSPTPVIRQVSSRCDHRVVVSTNTNYVKKHSYLLHSRSNRGRARAAAGCRGLFAARDMKGKLRGHGGRVQSTGYLAWSGHHAQVRSLHLPR